MRKKLFYYLMILFLLFVSQTTTAQNLLYDGAFSSTTSITPLGAPPVLSNTWYSWKNEATVSGFVSEVTGGVCSFSCTNGGYNTWDIQLNQYGFALTKGDAYRLTFDVKSDAFRSFYVYIGEEGGNWTNLNLYGYYQYSGTSWQTITITFIATSVFPLHKLSFELGTSNVKTYFDNIVLEKIVPTRVVLPGSIQIPLGCSPWNPGYYYSPVCTELVKNSTTGKWEGSFTLPEGCYEYKVAINGTWDINYGEGGLPNGPNIKLNIPTNSVVTFTYDPETHLVVSTPYSGAPITGISLVGEFQSELGCSWDWDYDGCNKPALTWNSTSGLWEGTFNLQAGCYKYAVKELTNCGFSIYGKDGINWGGPYGNAYSLFVPTQTDVTISYDPVTRKTTSAFNAEVCPPNTVVLPGTFQSELGCVPVTYINGDWEPGCDYTRLTYNTSSGLWEGTFDIPAGYWEYKVAYNNSWAENYGMNGERNGPNIPLELCVPTRITFKYNHTTHLLELVPQTTAICINKFYDANVNGIQDYNEPGLEGVTIILSGDASSTATTDATGKASFTGLVPGNYTVTESLPTGYYATTASAKTLSLGLPMKMEVGNVCLGPGGLKGMGFWMSKNGMDKLMDGGSMEPELSSLSILHLRNADGSEFKPTTYEQLHAWLKKANATNMAYMLSAQLAVLFLNYEAGYIKWDSYLYTPGCGTLGEGNFSFWYYLYTTAYYSLWSYEYTPAGHAQRSYQECLKNALDNANNNLSFVQAQPCTLAMTEANRSTEEVILPLTGVTLWPNPASSQFSLKVTGESSEPVFVKVYDANGRLVHSLNGTTNRVYQFGEQFRSGIYFAEIIRGKERTTKKLIKQ